MGNPGAGNDCLRMERPQMATIELTHEIELDDEQQEALADVLGCEVAELGARLKLCASAALKEYVGMMTGELPLTTVTDVRERRLLGLITIAFEGRIPSVDSVAKLFNLPPSGARSLLRNVASKHRRKLAAALTTETGAFLDACVQDDAGEWRGACLNPVLIEYLNDSLANANQSKERIRRDTGVLAGYVVPPGSYDWLRGNR